MSPLTGPALGLSKESQVGTKRDKKRVVAKEWAQAKYDVRTRRAKGLCEVRVSDMCPGAGAQFHHRKRRSHGGDHTMANGLWVCMWCHDFIHRQPAVSYAMGWLVAAESDPAETAVIQVRP